MSTAKNFFTLARRDSSCPSCSELAQPPRAIDPLRLWRYAGLALPVAFLAVIELLVRASILPMHLVPAPSAIAQTLWDLGAARLARHVGASVIRVYGGFAIGAALALLIGAAMGLSRRVDALLDPAFQALRAIPSLAWVPILLLWMGIDEAPKITLIAIGAFFPVQLSVVAGIRGVDRKLIEFGELNRLSRRALFTRILLPASMPQIFTGLRTGLSLAWMFMVAAELIAATRGLGYLLSDGRETGRPDLVFGAILLLALLGKLSDGMLKAIEVRALSWRDAHQVSEAAR
ncbi:sulfonate transport system permease protein [Paraburkholderia atlantica]|uniref:Sulfonate transport system permease protein n=1 Tax=Paraburkholderia atlantica TaxID=2654982 RepID=A0A6I1PUQ8_PARAM|nr:ABC transporter permease [Paraburkholderia atlantica]MBB5417572.1 sulfonate transport system permease protein [Paraburkholderia atlantica]MBB5425810.1 sulfonate transport system permease protein [Paraburkholderia atlantica]MPW06873.1 ABC transporter permease subunit [Paraburkholderia atlantica]NUY32886.1 ABC transporter permease [Paraburkholderia atlantica]